MDSLANETICQIFCNCSAHSMIYFLQAYPRMARLLWDEYALNTVSLSANIIFAHKYDHEICGSVHAIMVNPIINIRMGIDMDTIKTMPSGCEIVGSADGEWWSSPEVVISLRGQLSAAYVCALSRVIGCIFTSCNCGQDIGAFEHHKNYSRITEL